MRLHVANVLKCLKCAVPVSPEARQWHFTRYVARVDVRMSLCPECDSARGNGCAICRRTAMASVPLCADCLIEREAQLQR